LSLFVDLELQPGILDQPEGKRQKPTKTDRTKSVVPAQARMLFPASQLRREQFLRTTPNSDRRRKKSFGRQLARAAKAVQQR
jgi:hypothetical protein